ncbi:MULTISPECIES: Yip1 family protein [unclassified Sporosarcina]|uniref:Yip1 family protein n=1 Tax=unclassified Sporosarcina TaxID=2647733 RepID=UPI001304648E|nr:MULTISPECIES: Yip1 family protein [unclassified Sporosarcina]
MNPLISIWTQPKQTIRYVLEYKTWSYSFFILFLVSVSVGITSFAETDILPDLSLPIMILLGILSSFIGAVISLFISSALYTWVGKWLGGKGNFKDMVQMSPIASIPLIWMMPINLLLVFIFGKNLFIDMMNTADADLFGTLSVVLLLTNLLILGLSIFNTVILSKGIGIVHQFSSWRGFSTILIVIGLFLALMIPFIIFLVFVLLAY